MNLENHLDDFAERAETKKKVAVKKLPKSL
jgi:hypothetical protein